MMTNDTENNNRSKRIFRVTFFGMIINTLLVLLKFVAGVLGRSSAMLADAVHSLSDFLSDIAVLVLVRISDKPEDKDHNYGHGKFETLATILIGALLLVVGATLLGGGIEKIIMWAKGETLIVPGKIALWAALASIVLKELTYQITARVGRQVKSETVKANAWHHRSDALSSLGTAFGIGGAILLGDRWAVLDPIAAVVVSIFIIITGAKLGYHALSELLEHSLPDDVQNEIRDIVAKDTVFTELHNLRTRTVGNQYAIEMHLRMPGETILYVAHEHSIQLELKLKERFGPKTHIGIHIEPTKVDGKYQEPKAEITNTNN